MDEFLREINTLVFKQWILSQTNDDYSIKLKEDDDSVIVIDTAYSHSEITFNKMSIIEFIVTNLTTNNAEFYLHFQMNTLSHAIELYEEMLDAIKKLVKKPVKKILLSCSGGLTTGFFAEKLNEIATLLDLDYEFSAVPYNELFESGKQYDIVLLAPQISYMHAKVEEALKNKVVLKIPPQTFAKYDAGKMISLIQEALRKNKGETIKTAPLSLKQSIDNTCKILTIALIRGNEQVFFDYRIYNKHNQIILDGEVIKSKVSLNDLYDIIDTVTVEHPDIKIISISMPGIINDGRLSWVESGFNDYDIMHYLTKKYPYQFLISNDVNCIAAGYYVSQDQYPSLSFMFIPLMGRYGGIGNIVNGQLLTGRKNIAGEMKYLPIDIVSFENDKTKILDDSIEMMAKTVTCIIAMLDPETIIISSYFLKDSDELLNKTKKYLPEKYIPPIVLIDSLKEYNLLGQMVLAARHFNAYK